MIANVKPKVSCTDTFIQAGRLVHGDKYDYSETVYDRAGKPITIICKVCGPFVLAEASSHHSKKACGCRRCGTRSYRRTIEWRNRHD